jgi:Dullard-like phosphatase family protein
MCDGVEKIVNTLFSLICP